MAKKKFIPAKYTKWIEARKRYRLTDAHIQMARELNLNPDKFGKLSNHDQEQWKLPLPLFIEEIYFKHFGRERPADVRSIEQIIKNTKAKKEDRKRRKQDEKSMSFNKGYDGQEKYEGID